MIHINDLKNGMSIKHDGQIFLILDFLHVKPGKGPAFMRLKLKNMRTGATIEKTFNTNIKFEQAMISKEEMQFLYANNNDYCFMNMKTYEQVMIDKEQIENEIKFLKEGLNVNVIFYEGELLGMQLPEKITYVVKETQEATKGNTVNNANKEAILENDLKVKVPMFVKNGDQVIVSTRTGEYDSRV